MWKIKTFEKVKIKTDKNYDQKICTIKNLLFSKFKNIYLLLKLINDMML
jgi:hypothetical protein